MNSIKGKKIVVAVTGSVAAYKACDLVSRLLESEAHPKVIMTESAKKFVSPLSFESLTGEPVISSLWNPVEDYPATFHISLAEEAECAVVAPATANIIGKLRCGISDEIVSCFLCAFSKPILMAPAMNTAMYENPAVQENIAVLKGRGVHFIDPVVGILACRTKGIGKMAEPAVIIENIAQALS